MVDRPLFPTALSGHGEDFSLKKNKTDYRKIKNYSAYVMDAHSNGVCFP